MKRLCLSILVIFATMSLAMAQNTPIPGAGTPPTLANGAPTFNTALGADVLGAHNGYGRGCVMCHAPHSGSLGNGKGTSSDPQNGQFALWGQDLTPLFNQTFFFSGDGKTTYTVTLPAAGTLTSAHDANTIILFCLSCHDGNLAKVGMMKGQTVEVLPVVGGTAPTLLGADFNGGSLGNYSNDHPVGGYAIVGCTSGGTIPTSGTFSAAKVPNSQYNWDCTGGGSTPITMGPNMTQFVTVNYKASLWRDAGGKLSTFGGTGGIVTAVSCTTCHDQHSMTVYTNSQGSWSTMFFIRGLYAPSTGGNSVAQFCRNCHGGESNEMNGLMNVPTT